MELQTVIQNLRNTIAGKENMLETMESRVSKERTAIDQIAFIATINFLEINIGELKKILADLEQCSPTWNQFNCPFTEVCHRID